VARIVDQAAVVALGCSLPWYRSRCLHPSSSVPQSGTTST